MNHQSGLLSHTSAGGGYAVFGTPAQPFVRMSGIVVSMLPPRTPSTGDYLNNYTGIQHKHEESTRMSSTYI